MSASVDIILLAAGASSRMRGGDKTLEPVFGVPLLRRLAMECMNSQAARTVIVLPPDCPERKDAITDLDVETLVAKDAALGMSASIKAGIGTLSDADAALIVLADMPEITTTHIDAMIAAYNEDRGRVIIRAANANGQSGHPVLFDKSLFEALEDLSGDQGAKDLMKAHPVHRVPLHGSAAITDLDTPEDWEAWRALSD